MIALDTNVVVRFLVADDPAQHAASVRVFGSGKPLFLADSVFLECCWVLKSCYNLPRAAVVDALCRVIGLAQVSPENPARMARALAWYERGLDPDDALHLATAENHCRSLLTFDADFVKRAKGLAACRVGVPK